MKSSWRLWRASVAGLVTMVGLVWTVDASARQFVGVQVASGKKIVTMRAGVSARTFRNLTRRGFRHEVRVWHHKGKRWGSMYTRTLRRASWKIRLSKVRACRGHKGRMVVQIGIGRQHRGKWYNPRARKWQRLFVPYQNQMVVVHCGHAVIRRVRRGGVRLKSRTTVKRRALRGGRVGARAGARLGARARAGRIGRVGTASRYGNAWRGINHFRGRYGNAWRPVKTKGRYGNAWRGTKNMKVKGRYGNAWRGTKGKKGRYGNAWRK